MPWLFCCTGIDGYSPSFTIPRRVRPHSRHKRRAYRPIPPGKPLIQNVLSCPLLGHQFFGVVSQQDVSDNLLKITPEDFLIRLIRISVSCPASYSRYVPNRIVRCILIQSSFVYPVHCIPIWLHLFLPLKNQ